MDHEMQYGYPNNGRDMLKQPLSFLSGRCYIDLTPVSNSTSNSKFSDDESDDLQLSAATTFSGQAIAVVTWGNPHRDPSSIPNIDNNNIQKTQEADSVNAYFCLASPSNSFYRSGQPMMFHYDPSTFVKLPFDSENKYESLLSSEIGTSCHKIFDIVQETATTTTKLSNYNILNEGNYFHKQNKTLNSFESVSIQVSRDQFQPPMEEDPSTQLSSNVCGFVATISPTSEEGLRGLQSLTLRRLRSSHSKLTSNNDNEDSYNKTGNNNSSKQSLLAACIKREMVGRIVCQGTVTKIELPFFRGEEENNTNNRTNSRCHSYKVTHLIPVISSLNEGYSYEGGKYDTRGVYVILPNTLITIGDEGENNVSSSSMKSKTSSLPHTDADENDSQQNTDIEHSSNITSHAIRVLSQTLSTINSQFEKKKALLAVNANSSITTQKMSMVTTMIPKAFLLSGPPGVGKTYAVRTAMKHAIPSSSSTSTIHLTSIRGSEIMGLGHVAQVMAELARLFQGAIDSITSTTTNDESANVAIVFLDECDALLTSSSPLVSTQLGVLLDRISSSSPSSSAYKYGWDRLVVVAATNRVDSIPSWLRRPGRFDREIVVTPPNAKERERILISLLKEAQLPSKQVSSLDLNEGAEENDDDTESFSSASSSSTLSSDRRSPRRRGFGNDESHESLLISNKSIAATLSKPVQCREKTPIVSALSENNELSKLAEECVGYVAADLASLVRRAMMLQMVSGNDDANGLKNLTTLGDISIEFLRKAMLDVGASALRDAALSAPPATRWNDIAGDAGGAKKALRRAVEWPRTKRDSFLFLGLSPPRGILLHGPPGCAKTTLARAAAGASGIAFLSLSPADVYASSYVGEAESVIRRAFSLARSVAPCILFFDEIDAILGSAEDGNNPSGSGMNRGSSAEARVMSTFLNEMDGVDASSDDGVLVLGATNRPHVLDAALLRPGRFDSVIYVPPPDFEARRSILERECQRWQTSTAVPTSSEIEWNTFIDELARNSASMTGAEIVGACKEASISAIREAIELKHTNTQATISAAQDGKSNDLELIVLPKHIEQAFRDTKPLLSDEKVLSEYSSFDLEHSSRKGGGV